MNERNILVMVILLMIMIVFIVLGCNSKKNLPAHLLGVVALFFSMALVFTLTGITPSGTYHVQASLENASLIPFDSLEKMLSYHINGVTYGSLSLWDAIYYLGTNILGNIIMFIPMGFLLPLLWRRYQKIGRTLFAGILISFLIEFSQLFSARGTDVDDIILNTCGALLGYLTFRILKYLAPNTVDSFILPEEEKRTVKIYPRLCLLMPYLVMVLIGLADISGVIL